MLKHYKNKQIRMAKNIIGEMLIKAGMVPVFYHEDIEICKNVVEACYNGGLRIFEYTNRGAKALENFPELQKFVKRHCKGMLLGIGSINNVSQAKDFLMLKPDFIVSPIFDPEVAAICNAKEVYWVPGCATLSEIASAEKAGADIIKIFPGNVLGPGFVKAVLGPMPHLKLMPTGGVSPAKENLEAWYTAGVVCVGMGSQLLNKDAIKQPKVIEEMVSDTLNIIREIRE